MSKQHICHFPCETAGISPVHEHFHFHDVVQFGKLDEKSENTERSSLFRLVICVLHHRDLSKVMWRQKSLFLSNNGAAGRVILNIIPFFSYPGYLCNCISMSDLF